MQAEPNKWWSKGDLRDFLKSQDRFLVTLMKLLFEPGLLVLTSNYGWIEHSLFLSTFNLPGLFV